MASSRSTNTMEEFLRRILGDIAEAKTLPDADLEFLVGMETGILQKLRQPVDAMQGQTAGVGDMEAGQASALSGADPMAGAMGMGGMGDPMGGAMPGQVPMAGGVGVNGSSGGGVPGLASEPTIPPDELRRMLGR